MSSGCGCKEVYTVYINFLILLIPTPLVSALFCSSIPTFCSFFSFLFQYFFVIKIYVLNNFFMQYKHTYRRLRASHGSHMNVNMHKGLTHLQITNFARCGQFRFR